jgi:iron-sulfur cluster repair protein YtfE (RIC family)
MTDPLDLAVRTGLPDDMLYLVREAPRDRWTGLGQTAAFWMQMHAGFRAQQARMAALTDRWRAGDLDPRGLHDAVLPELQHFLQHLDGHHRVETGHYFPAFRAAEPRIQHGLDLLDRDHDAIHAHLETLFQSAVAFHHAVRDGAPGAAEAAHRLSDALAAAAPPLSRHLDDEEDIVIPLMQLRGVTHG